MRIITIEQQGSTLNFFFDTKECVSINQDEETWEYWDDNDTDIYFSGMIELEGGTVTGYDGCYDLPEAVKVALSQIYDIDL